jgi:hypothetical protein
LSLTQRLSKRGHFSKVSPFLKILRRLMAQIHISKDPPKQIPVAFAYALQLIAKAKTIPEHTWNPAEKHWCFPNTWRTMERIPEIDTSVSTLNISKTRSPLDNLDLKKRGGNKNNHWSTEGRRVVNYGKYSNL